MTYVDMLESLRTDPNVTTEDTDSLVNLSVLIRGAGQLLWSESNHTDDQMTVEVKALIDSLYAKYNP